MHRRTPIGLVFIALFAVCGLVLLRARTAHAPARLEHVEPLHAPPEAPPRAAEKTLTQSATPPRLPPHVSAAPEPADAGPKRAPEPEMRWAERELMGTIWKIGISGGDETKTKPASERALDEVERLEMILSEWLPDSEVSRVNAQAFTVGQDVYYGRGRFDPGATTGGAKGSSRGRSPLRLSPPRSCCWCCSLGPQST